MKPPLCCKCNKRSKKGHWGPRDRWICHICARLGEQRIRIYNIAGSGAVKDDDYTVDVSGKVNRR